MLGQTNGASSAHRNDVMSSHQQFPRCSPKTCRPQPVDVLPVSTLKRQMKMKRHFTNVSIMPVKPFATVLRQKEWIRQSIIRLVQTYLYKGTRARAHTHARTRAHTHIHTYTHTHT